MKNITLTSIVTGCATLLVFSIVISTPAEAQAGGTQNRKPKPDVVAILSESEHIFRLVYTDGRDHPPDAKDYPAWYGYSVGKWQGDTLVVDTISVNDRTWLDTAGHDHSDKLYLTERFRLADPDTLEFVVTYDDPVFFVKPFTSKKILIRQIGDYIYDHACLENEKDLENLVPTIGDDGR